MNKTKADFTLRPDGKFNIWSRTDHFPGGDQPPYYGDWTIIHVAETREEAVTVLRAHKCLMKS